MVAWSYLVQDAATGTTVAEVDLRDAEITLLLSDVGSCTGSIPLDDPKATTGTSGVFRAAQRDLSVFADGDVVFNGPITRTFRNLQTRQMEITARELPWIFGKATVETNKSYATDIVSIVVNLINVYLLKTGGSLYRFSTTLPPGGGSKTWAFSGYSRRNILQSVMDLAADTFDFRMVYTNSGEQVTRLFEIGVPTLGVTRGEVLEAAAGLLDLGVEEDIDRAANRVHCIGGNGLVHTSTNTASYSAGDRLLEEVLDRTDLTSSALITAAAQEGARALKPPVRVYSAEVGWTTALPFGFCSPGDTVNLNEPALGVTDVDQRVIGLTHRPQDAKSTLMFADT